MKSMNTYLKKDCNNCKYINDFTFTISFHIVVNNLRNIQYISYDGAHLLVLWDLSFD